MVMPYLYGDTSPFPLDENFIETLAVVVEACVSLLRVDEELEDLGKRTEAVKLDAVSAQAQLEEVSGTLAGALERFLKDPERGGKVAGSILHSARGVLDRARAEVTSRREKQVREHAINMNSVRGGVVSALELLFVRHELPGTTWRVDWRGGAGEASSSAIVTGATPFKLDLRMDADVAPSSPFARAPRVSELERGLTMRLPEKAMFGPGIRMKKRSLDHYVLTEVEIAPERASMVLRRAIKGPAPGVEIVMRSYGTSSPTVRRLTEAGPAAREDSLVLDADGAATAWQLWKQVETHVGAFARRRSKLTAATLDGRAVEEIRRPAMLAELIIGSVAGLVREVVQRSPAGAELVLKRDTGNGRREEIYVPRDELTGKMDVLHSERRRMFDVFGLDENESTKEHKVIYDDSVPAIEISQVTEVATA
jgi:hypothetical protein